MPRYQVNHRYSAVDNGVLIGPFVAGSAVELGADRAEWVNRDSPGTLTAAGQADEKPVTDPEAANDEGQADDEETPDDDPESTEDEGQADEKPVMRRRRRSK